MDQYWPLNLNTLPLPVPLKRYLNLEGEIQFIKDTEQRILTLNNNSHGATDNQKPSLQHLPEGPDSGRTKCMCVNHCQKLNKSGYLNTEGYQKKFLYMLPSSGEKNLVCCFMRLSDEILTMTNVWCSYYLISN